MVGTFSNGRETNTYKYVETHMDIDEIRRKIMQKLMIIPGIRLSFDFYYLPTERIKNTKIEDTEL